MFNLFTYIAICFYNIYYIHMISKFIRIKRSISKMRFPLFHTITFHLNSTILSLSVIAILVFFNTVSAENINKANIDTSIDKLLAIDHVKDEIIIQFNDDVSASNSRMETVADEAHSETGAVIKKSFKKLKGMQLISISGNDSMKNALKSYLQNPKIKYAEPNYVVHAMGTPNDPAFSVLWGLNNTGQTGGTVDADIDAVEAWAISTGSSDVVIAVIDSGVAINSTISTGHPEMAGNIWLNTGETDCSNGVDDDSNGYIDDCFGWDFVDDDNDPMDYKGHGTHVAGTIAAVGNNGQGISGVMWNASIMPLRFLDSTGSGSTADAISAILYANANGAHVINNSWGGGGYSQALSDAISASNAVVVCAAGNSGTNNDSTPFYPASYTSDNIISVAATDKNDKIASFSNYGATSVDVAAPGVSIYSTLPARNQHFFDNMTNLNNWTSELSWGLSSINYSSPNSASDSPSGNYLDNTSASLVISNPLNLSEIRGSVLDYMLRLETESNYDFICIDASTTGISWNNIVCYHGSTNNSFYAMNEDLAQYDEQGSFYLRFRLESDSSITYDGAYIDNVIITTYSENYSGTEYAYYNGTSMAAPHVSGVAGLLKAYKPNLSNLEIKAAILENSDSVISLNGKVITGGRLNAFGALNSVYCPRLPVIIANTGDDFTNMQDAYDAAGSGDIIFCHETTFTEDLVVDLNKEVTFQGGYNCDYSARSGMSTFKGNVTITNRTLIFEDFIIK